MDLDLLTGLEFEELCEKLFLKMGYYVETTKASHDGGIDLIVVNNSPITSGRYVVQCKRYIGSVGEPAIRDLYGTTISESANKGILITTGTFTTGAISFSKNKQIELIDGPILEELLILHNIIENEVTNNNKEKLSQLIVGDRIFLGKYPQDNLEQPSPIKWRILATDLNRALLISEHSLDVNNYHSLNRNVKWKESSLRTWLNNDFYDIAFSPKEKLNILNVPVNDINSWKKESRLNTDEKDKVFILAPEEVLEYLPDMSDRQATPTIFTKSKGIEQNEKYADACIWWLRQSSSGNGSDSCCVGVAGNIVIEKANNKDGFYRFDRSNTVRPVIVITNLNI